ncbi:hypothetical protein [Paenibacillus faecalis]|uniref:hypothetical protein n=1 Tax=Paenibacillus faecalis TaxID=2079532 RepID=UPI000D0E64ED|nr:hypothetical protein [Paenibacillus faecalis]
MTDHFAKILNIYVDSEKLYICSTQTVNKTYETVEKGFITELNSLSSEGELQAALFESLKNCNLELLDENPEVSSLEKHLGVKGYDKAIKDKKGVTLFLVPKEGYSITPTEKYRWGYMGIGDEIHLSVEDALVNNNLAKAVLQAISLSRL